MPGAVDLFVRNVEIGYKVLYELFKLYSAFVLLKFPNGMLYTIVCNAINATMAVYAGAQGKEPLYWLHSLILVVMAAFGGGIIAPLLAGRPCIIVANDTIIPVCLVVWYLIFHIPYVEKFFSQKPVRAIWIAFVGLFRTHAITNNVTATMNVLSAGELSGV
jgi:uncharacterized membrane protein YeiH